MTQEEMEAMISEQAEKLKGLEAANQKIAELEAKVTPPVDDPDDAYKPKTWKELHEREGKVAEETAMRVLKEAEEKREKIRKADEETQKKQDEAIDATLKKLEEEGVIDPTSDKGDKGGRQRTQILGMTLRLQGTDVEAAARMLKTAWDSGMEYDYETNTYSRAGSQARYAPVGSSASRTPAAPREGAINLKGISGDLDEAQRRWEENHR